MSNFHELVKIKRGSCTPEKFRMKADLQRWGRTAQILDDMNNEIKKMTNSLEKLKKNDAFDESGAEQLFISCQERIDSLKKEANELMDFAMRMDSIVSQLEDTEQIYIRMRYQRGMAFDIITRKMYISRATVFRLQDNCIKHMLEIINENSIDI